MIIDHSSLKWLCNLHDPTGNLARWALEMKAYDYDVEHRKGSLNHVPDVLSRIFEDEKAPDFASINISEETVQTDDAWYKPMFAAVGRNPGDHP